MVKESSNREVEFDTRLKYLESFNERAISAFEKIQEQTREDDIKLLELDKKIEVLSEGTKANFIKLEGQLAMFQQSIDSLSATITTRISALERKVEEFSSKQGALETEVDNLEKKQDSECNLVELHSQKFQEFDLKFKDVEDRLAIVETAKEKINWFQGFLRVLILGIVAFIVWVIDHLSIFQNMFK